MLWSFSKFIPGWGPNQWLGSVERQTLDRGVYGNSSSPTAGNALGYINPLRPSAVWCLEKENKKKHSHAALGYEDAAVDVKLMVTALRLFYQRRHCSRNASRRVVMMEMEGDLEVKAEEEPNERTCRENHRFYYLGTN